MQYDKDLKDADAAVDAKYADPRVFSLHRCIFVVNLLLVNTDQSLTGTSFR